MLNKHTSRFTEPNDLVKLNNDFLITSLAEHVLLMALYSISNLHVT